MAGRMICLDTNFLILGLASGSAESEQLVVWARASEVLVTPAVAWYEFLCGPVTPIQIATIRAFLRDVIAFDVEQASAAARLFTAAGRNRRLRVDVLIAAAAMSIGASLATNNRADFQPFLAHGLKLADSEII